MTKVRAERRANAGAKTVGRPHSTKSEEITRLFVIWGIIGELRERPARISYLDRLSIINRPGGGQ